MDAQDLPNEAGRLTGVARRSAENLLGLLDDILDFAKLEAGRVVINNEPCSPTRIVEEVLATFRPIAEEKGLTLSYHVRGSAPGVVETDPARLRQILFNIVGNAVKFTSSGGVTVLVGRGADLSPANGADGPAAGDPDSGDRSAEGDFLLEFEINDTGIGISADAIPNLFQRFTQADNSITRKYGGAGLGLAICKELCVLLGGDIRVRSTPGHGSTFHFRVACRPCVPENGEAFSSRDGAVATVWDAIPPSRVLVVDDNAVNRDILSAMLGRGNHKATTACDGHEAVSLASHEDFDVVLMDIQMPGMDGLTATGLIRKLPPPRGTVPVIAFTAHSTGSGGTNWTSAGMNGFVAKPVRPAELFAEMGRLLGSNTNITPVADGAMDEALKDAATTSGRTVCAETANLLDEEQIAIVADVLGADEWASACEMFALSAKEQIDELRTAVDEGQPHHTAAHTLKGAALNIGAKRLSALALAAERTPTENIRPLIDDMAEALKATISALDKRFTQ
jgi:CheY-like chemotaxis protein